MSATGPTTSPPTMKATVLAKPSQPHMDWVQRPETFWRIWSKEPDHELKTPLMVPPATAILLVQRTNGESVKERKEKGSAKEREQNEPGIQKEREKKRGGERGGNRRDRETAVGP